MKQYKYTINGAQFDVTIDSIVGSKAKVEVNGIPFEVEMQGSSLVEEALPTVSTDAAAPAAASAPAATETPAAVAPAATSGPGAGAPVKAPLPGVVTKNSRQCRSSCEERRHRTRARSHEDGKQHHGRS